MKVKLNIKDRLTIISILPSTGNMSDLLETLELIKIIKFSDEEKEQISYKEHSNGKITWDISKEEDKEFDINSDQIRILKQTIQDLDSKRLITLSTLETCLKIKDL